MTPCCGQCAHLGHDLLERAAHFLAARVRHDAERAVLAAAFHDRDERRGARGARLRQPVEFLDLGKADVDDRAAMLLQLGEHVGQAVDGLRPEHEVDERRTLRDALAFLAGHATARRR